MDGLARAAPRPRASAAAKIAGSGLAAPTSAELSAPSTSGARPVAASASCSETSQFETTTSRAPAARSARSVVGDLGVRAEADRGEQRGLEVAPRRGRAAAAPRAGPPCSARAAARAPRGRPPCRGGRGRRRSPRAARPPPPPPTPRPRARPARPPAAARAARARAASRARRAGTPAASPDPAPRRDPRADERQHDQRRPDDDRAARAAGRPATSATHRCSGHSTATKRGSDISGWPSDG